MKTYVSLFPNHEAFGVSEGFNISITYWSGEHTGEPPDELLERLISDGMINCAGRYVVATPGDSGLNAHSFTIVDTGHGLEVQTGWSEAEAETPNLSTWPPKAS